MLLEMKGTTNGNWPGRELSLWLVWSRRWRCETVQPFEMAISEAAKKIPSALEDLNTFLRISCNTFPTTERLTAAGWADLARASIVFELGPLHWTPICAQVSENTALGNFPDKPNVLRFLVPQTRHSSISDCFEISNYQFTCSALVGSVRVLACQFSDSDIRLLVSWCGVSEVQRC